MQRDKHGEKTERQKKPFRSILSITHPKPSIETTYSITMIAARQTSQTGQMSQVSQVSQVSRTGLAPRPLNPARLRSSAVSSLYTLYTFHTLHTRCPRPAAGGPAGGWFDLANFVATSSSNKTPFDDFAASIGKDICTFSHSLSDVFSLSHAPARAS